MDGREHIRGFGPGSPLYNYSWPQCLGLPNCSPGIEFGSACGYTSFTCAYIGNTLEISLYLALKCNSSPDKKIPLFYIIQAVFYIIQYTQSHGVNICSFGVIKLQNPKLHLSRDTPTLSQPFNP